MEQCLFDNGRRTTEIPTPSVCRSAVCLTGVATTETPISVAFSEELRSFSTPDFSASNIPFYGYP